MFYFYFRKGIIEAEKLFREYQRQKAEREQKQLARHKSINSVTTVRLVRINLFPIRIRKNHFTSSVFIYSENHFFAQERGGGSVADPDDFCPDPAPDPTKRFGSGSLIKKLNNFKL